MEYACHNIAKVQQAVQELEIKTESKFSVYFTQLFTWCINTITLLSIIFYHFLVMLNTNSLEGQKQFKKGWRWFGGKYQVCPVVSLQICRCNIQRSFFPEVLWIYIIVNKLNSPSCCYQFGIGNIFTEDLVLKTFILNNSLKFDSKMHLLTVHFYCKEF